MLWTKVTHFFASTPPVVTSEDRATGRAEQVKAQATAALADPTVWMPKPANDSISVEGWDAFDIDVLGNDSAQVDPAAYRALAELLPKGYPVDVWLPGDTTDLTTGDGLDVWMAPFDETDVSVRIVGLPAHGTATVKDHGIRYRPHYGWVGADSLTYSITFGASGHTAKAKVRIKVGPEPHIYYENCAAARAAGDTPLYRGEPGYAPWLDRDGDGIACEWG
ncbi:excalibur calcium-binding domain-containing protein [Streptacidiphilus monticola]|uniref:Excalibur calcium-binding domain-containing protein n=1 Tax=Streptacidiphilus monticola TaxID=2161674 RepID=A0ABW1GBM1_9ACTN